jgi:hypothetical protein
MSVPAPQDQHSRNQKSLANARGSVLKVHTQIVAMTGETACPTKNRRGVQRNQDVSTPLTLTQ